MTMKNSMRRDRFGLVKSLIAGLAGAASASGPGASPVAAPADKKPLNIVWICLEDTSPTLGCYGDKQAITPNMDKLASQGALFTRAFTHGPVCAPSRAGLVTGQYATTISAHHMRSHVMAPPDMFTSLLRKAGYYVSWGCGPGTQKQDFNFTPPSGWCDDPVDSIAQIPKQPFFVFANLFGTHEMQVSAAWLAAKSTAKLSPEQRHDPAKMVVPPFLPDTPEVRRHIANYYDAVTVDDMRVGEILASLDRQGLADNTIVFLLSDHGYGLPRCKRWLYDGGTHVPLIVRWPGHIKPGTVREDLVAWVDMAPTVLHLAGLAVPSRMQGQVFLGPDAAPPRRYVYAARDRMDETFDRIRSVRDERFKYIRNFHPELPYSQPIPYMDSIVSMKVLRTLHAQGKLDATQELFFAPTKPKEELYDTQADPWEIHNLAADPKFQAPLLEMRAALDQWIVDTKDLGEMPETELVKRGLIAAQPAELRAKKTSAKKSKGKAVSPPSTLPASDAARE